MRRCQAPFLDFRGPIFGLMALAVVSFAHADESSQTQEAQSIPAKQTQLKPKTTKAKRRATTREKETEGTEAPDRFEADTVIKSQYQLDGKQLEVDPD